MNSLCLVALGVIFLVQGGACIKCYTCTFVKGGLSGSSDTTGPAGCEQYNFAPGSGITEVECGNSTNYCLKQYSKVEINLFLTTVWSETTTRGCGSQCTEPATDADGSSLKWAILGSDDKVSCCEGALCNGAGGVSGTAVTTVVSVILAATLQLTM